MTGERPFVIGITGPIASGKSVVAGMLARRGAEVIEADRVYHALLAPGSELSRRIAERFGPDVVRPHGGIDRTALGEIVFQDPAALADLERLTHPAVVARIRAQVAASAAPLVVIEAVKLVQSGLLDVVDALWIVTADPDVRLRRLMARSGIGEDEAHSRIAAIPNPVPADARPDAVIDNSGDLCRTERAVEAVLERAGLFPTVETVSRVTGDGEESN
jgi:dephospho-CoA kinase